MYEGISSVGERGQITLPKALRNAKGIKPKDKVIVKIEDERIVVEKALGRREKESLMKEFYVKYDKLNKQTEEDWKFASVEADRLLDER